ncbi:MAG: putative 2OG-Fe(II) oxygenase [Kangiellaceae bacterium]|nr:putative 2OG-Fe(II) oxygenase [Kangiellaceae bacterium]
MKHQVKLKKALALYNSGKLKEAKSAFLSLVKKESENVDLLYVIGLTHKKLDEFEQAISYLIKAHRLAAFRTDILLDVSSICIKIGKNEKAIKILKNSMKIVSESSALLYNTALAYFNSNKLNNSQFYVNRLLEKDSKQLKGLALYSEILIKKQEHKEAIVILDKCILLSQNLRFYLRKANLYILINQYHKAKIILDNLNSSENFRTPELYLTYFSYYIETNDIDNAKVIIDKGIDKYPTNEQLQYQRAKFMCEIGKRSSYLDKLLLAIDANQTSVPLWGSLLDILSHQQKFEDMYCAVEQAEKSIGSNSDRILLAKAVAFSGLEKNNEADKIFSQLVRDNCPATPHRLYAEHLIKNCDYKKASVICDQLLNENRYDQAALAYKSLALAHIEPSEYARLVDFKNMVKQFDIASPKEYDNRSLFIADVLDELLKLHRFDAHPLDQTLREGTQTNGFLFSNNSKPIQLLYREIKTAIRKYIEECKEEPTHPFWSRVSKDFYLDGAWSVVLKKTGYHTNHYHPKGWLSSALYLKLPEINDESKEGYLMFGEPSFALKDEVIDRHFVKPKVGTLCLFPSYFWHGTVPFNSDETRVTVAFDINPS